MSQSEVNTGICVMPSNTMTFSTCLAEPRRLFFSFMSVHLCTVVIIPQASRYECIIINLFCYFSTETYFVDNHKNRLNET